MILTIGLFVEVGKVKINAFWRPLVKFLWTTVTTVSRHFGPKTFRHYCDGAEVSGHFGTGGTSAEMSGHFGTIKYCLFTKRKLHTHHTLLN